MDERMRGAAGAGARSLPPRQLALWDGEIASAVPAADAADSSPPQLLVACPDRRGQFALFEDRIQLVGEVESSFDEADCDALTSAVLRLGAAYGDAALPEELRDWLPSALAPGFWEQEQPLAVRLRALDATLEGLSEGRAQRFREGFLRRLLERHRAQDIVDVCPELLPVLHALLWQRGRSAEARRLVLDALLAGRALFSLEFSASGDGELVELLAENLAPGWLACHGVARALWQPPRIDRNAIHALEREIDAALPRSDERRALAFWSCLVALWNRHLLSTTLESRAQARMKRLNWALYGVLAL